MEENAALLLNLLPAPRATLLVQPSAVPLHRGRQTAGCPTCVAHSAAALGTAGARCSRGPMVHGTKGILPENNPADRVC